MGHELTMPSTVGACHALLMGPKCVPGGYEAVVFVSGNLIIIIIEGLSLLQSIFSGNLVISNSG